MTVVDAHTAAVASSKDNAVITRADLPVFFILFILTFLVSCFALLFCLVRLHVVWRFACGVPILRGGKLALPLTRRTGQKSDVGCQEPDPMVLLQWFVEV